MKKIIFGWLCCLSFSGIAQQKLPLTDLSGFDSKKDNWKIVGDATASIDQKNTLISRPGTGVLVCKHDQDTYGEEFDLFTKEEYGDMDLSLEFMLGRESNSGIYLQGRYEVQLYDSWGVKNPKFYDCGGIYQRRNADGSQFEGYAPRYNAYKAPGLWNKMDISFQAPKFDASGKKISNAKILYVRLNGLLIHENVELSGPTGGAVGQNEVAKASLRIQGDHGSVAFRNIEIKNYSQKPGYVSDLSYKTYYGSYMHDADLSAVKVDAQGSTSDLTWEVTKEDNNYVFFIKGKYNAPVDGKYTFVTQLGGHGALKIDGKEVIDNRWTRDGTRSAEVELKAGEHVFELFNNKRDGWIKPVLGFWSSGPGFRLTPHHVPGSVISGKPNDPILLNANTNTNLRSFMDWKKKDSDRNFRVVHAISIGSPEGLHYTYDLDKGAIIQAWKGDFLDTTPMWHERGDGSSKPMGSITRFNHDLLLNPLEINTWKTDTTGTGYKPKGYSLDEDDLPTFHYKILGADVKDKVRIKDGKYIHREVDISNAANMFARLAVGDNVVQVAENLYAVDDKTYYVRIEDGAERFILNGNQLIVKPKNNSLRYSIIF